MFSRYFNLLLFITGASLLLPIFQAHYQTVNRLVVDAALLTRHPTAAPSVSAAPSLSAAPSPLPCSISPEELNALESLYNSTDGVNWLWRPSQFKKGTAWAVPAQVSDPCNSNWQGVTCQLTTSVGICYVEQLKLSLYNLNGSLPSEIGLLTGLTMLDFANNKLCNSITSQLFTLTKLTYLNISNNNLVGTIPLDITLMTALNNLVLSGNFLTNKIPIELSVLTGLTHLYISRNSFSHSIPSELSTLTNLIELSLFNNFLTNSIPSQLSTMTNLTILYLDMNFLTNSIPSQLAALTNMQYLDLYNNILSHSIPSELSTMTKLVELALFTNFLKNFVPTELSALTSLQNLWLYENQLIGSIPTLISNFYHLKEADLSVNFYTGDLPDMFCALPNLQVLQLSYNKLNGKLPPSFHCLNRSLEYIDVSVNNLHGDPFAFIGFPVIEFVNMSSNHFDDMPSFMSAPTEYVTSSLEYLDISLNYLQGSLPDNIGSIFPHLKQFSTSNNCFKSYIPESLCRLSNLTYILMNTLGSQCSSTDVSLIINALSRDVINSKHTIPSCLLSLPSLKTAHLIGNYLYGNLSEVSSTLHSLSVMGNVLVGSIPKSIQMSSKLTDLQLSLNRFSGTLLHDAFKNLPRESTIQFYANRIRYTNYISYFLLDFQILYTCCYTHSYVHIYKLYVFNYFLFPIDCLSFICYSCFTYIPLILLIFSGNIPSSIDTFKNSNIDILGGNLFSCNNEAPNNIEKYGSYSCGTASIDFYKYIYLAVGIALVVGSPVLFFLWKKRIESSQEPFWFVVLFKSVPASYPRHIFSALVNRTFLVTCLLVALFMTLFNLFMKMADEHVKDGELTFQASYSTHTLNYGWTTAFVYVHGIWPFVMISIALFITLFTYLRFIKYDYNGGVKESTPTIKDSASKSLSIYNNVRVLLVRLTRLFADANYWRFLLLQLIDFFVITGVNVLYIFIENETYFTLQSRYKKAVPILVSLVKIVWSNTFLVFIIKYGIRSRLPEHVVFGHYIFALLYIYVLVPIVTVFFTDYNCLYYRLNPPTAIEENYDGIIPYTYCLGFNCNNVYDPIRISQFVSPPWVYSYQCGFSILTNYVPVMLSKYTITGIFLPILQLIILYFPPSSWIRNLRFSKAILPYTSNAVSGDVTLDQNDRRHLLTYRFLSKTLIDVVMLFTFGIFCPFLTFIIVTSMIVNEAVNIVQIGSHIQDILQSSINASPPYVGSSNNTSSGNSNNNNTCSSNSSSNQVQMEVFSAAHSQHKDFEMNPEQKEVKDSSLARYSSRDSTLQSSSLFFSASGDVKQNNVKVSLEKIASSIYLDSAHTLFFTMWTPMLLTTLLFFTLVMFDIIADVYMNLAGLTVTVIFWIVIIVCFYSRERFDKIASSITPRICLCDGVDDDYIEMNEI